MDDQLRHPRPLLLLRRILSRPPFCVSSRNFPQQNGENEAVSFFLSIFSHRPSAGRRRMSFSSLVLSLSRGREGEGGEMAFLVAFLTNAKFMWSGGGGEREKVPLAALLFFHLFSRQFSVSSRARNGNHRNRPKMTKCLSLNQKSARLPQGGRPIAEGVCQYDSKLSFILGKYLLEKTRHCVENTFFSIFVRARFP